MSLSSKKNVIIVGGNEQACNTFKYLLDNKIANIVLVIARSDDTGEDFISPSLIKISKLYEIPFLTPKSINSKSVLEIVDRCDAHIVLSLQNNMLFSAEWIKMFSGRLGIVNVHYSPLPRYSGYWPEMWAIWNCETDFGVTMHYVSEGIDTGPIIKQRMFDISLDENRYSLYKKSEKECFSLLKDMIPKLLNEKQKCKSQDLSIRTYFKKSMPNDGFLDLNWDMEKQSRFIRSIAFPGYPGPKIKLGENIYTIVQEDLMFFQKYLLNSN